MTTRPLYGEAIDLGVIPGSPGSLRCGRIISAHRTRGGAIFGTMYREADGPGTCGRRFGNNSAGVPPP